MREHVADEVIMMRAELMWMKEVQLSLIDERRFKEWKHQLQLFQDGEGVWRCGGRLSNADIPYNTKHPVLLPNKHHFTDLVIQRAHARVFHNGVKLKFDQSTGL